MVTRGDADSCLAHGLQKCAPMSSFSAVEMDLQLVSCETQINLLTRPSFIFFWLIKQK